MVWKMSEKLTGKIYSFTEIQRDGAPTGFVGLAPYYVALVKTEGGPMVTAQLTDFGEELPVIGREVAMVTRKLRDDSDKEGIIPYGYKFRPNVPRATEAQVAEIYATIERAMRGDFD